MKKSIFIKIIFILLMIATILLIISTNSKAASLSISTSKSTVAPGETFTVTVSLSNGAGYVSSGGQTQWLDNSSFSYKQTAGSSGTVSITASGTAADYSTEKDESVYASKTVKIVSNTGGSSNTSGSSGTTNRVNSNASNTTTPEKVEKSKVNTLKELSVQEGTISPEFSVDIREYTLNIPYETTEINVTATPTDSKAKAEITGNTDLKEGENTVTITVTAENGQTSNYVIKVNRARVPLALKGLIVKYTNQNGELIELPLNPIFDSTILEYSLENLDYKVENLLVEAIANIEGATIDIEGADNLKTGENIIIVTIKIQDSLENLPEGEEAKEEVIVYTLKVNKDKEPTILGKISNWFKGIFGGVASGYNQNKEQIILCALVVCILALLGLSVYIIIDYNKYKVLLEKIKVLENINGSKVVKEEVSQKTLNNIEESNNNIETEKNRQKGGRHF